MRVLNRMLALVLFCAAGAFAADELPLDTQKYPQDTPQAALQSIIKSLETKDFAYWICHLILPEESKRITTKHGGLDKAAAANADPKYADRIGKQIAVMRAMLTGKTSELEKEGKKIVRFHQSPQVLQFEQQPDKRWCINIRVSTEQNMDNPPQPKSGTKDAEKK